MAAADEPMQGAAREGEATRAEPMRDASRGHDLITMGRSSIDLYSNDVGTPFEQITQFAAYVGGSPTNIATGARRLGLDVALLTAVGEDKVGDFILHFLRNEGIDTRFVPRKRDARSSAVILGIEEDRFPLVFYRDNAADMQLTIDDVDATPITAARALELGGTNLSREPSRSASFLAAETAKRAGTRVFFDVDFRADQWDDPRAFGVNVRAMLALSDVAIGTEEEFNAAMVTDPEDIVIRDQQISAPEIRGDLSDNLAAILAQPVGPGALVVKRGRDGVTVHLRGGEVIEVPGFPAQVMNVLGAGDAFAAGFIYGRLKGWDWYRASRVGNACGAIVVARHGCANFMGYEDEVLAYAESFGGL